MNDKEFQQPIKRTISNAKKLLSSKSHHCSFFYLEERNTATKSTRRFLFLGKPTPKLPKKKFTLSSANQTLQSLDKSCMPFGKKTRLAFGILQKQPNTTKLELSLQGGKSCSLEQLKKGLKMLEKSHNTLQLSKKIIWIEVPSEDQATSPENTDRTRSRPARDDEQSTRSDEEMQRITETVIREAISNPVDEIFLNILKHAGKQEDLDATFDTGDFKSYVKELGILEGEWFQGLKLKMIGEGLEQGFDRNGDGQISRQELSLVFLLLDKYIQFMAEHGDFQEIENNVERSLRVFEELNQGLDEISHASLKKHVADILPKPLPFRGTIVELTTSLAIGLLDVDDSGKKIKSRTLSKKEWLRAVTAIYTTA